MKIALLTNLVPPYRRAAFGLVAEHAKSVGGTSHVICTDLDETQHIWARQSAPFSCRSLSALRIPLGENRRLSFNFGVKRELARTAPNVLILSGFGPAMWRAQRWAKNHAIPTVVLFDGWQRSDAAYDNRVRRVLRQSLIKQASGFIAASSRGKDWFETFGVPPDQITVSPIPTSFAPPKAIPDFNHRPFDILWCGRTTTAKGFETFLQTARILKSRQAITKIGIIGALNMSRIAQQVAEHGLSDIADIHPLLPPECLPGFLTQAKICLFPSHNDAYGVGVVEAASCGTIVLASDAVGCAPDVLASDQILPPDSATDWATACEELLTNPGKWDHIRATQSASITTNTADHHARSIWQAVLAARSRSRDTA
ncbi:glycosyltransferase family 4 protein [Thalassospira lucentensis]|uniref:glycosyltransferase family 4 protein n=1 Tax=Thalassospira lucentensis TaxID=168935 RepID=UPI00399D64B1